MIGESLNIKVKKDFLLDYKKMCDDNGYNLSKRLRQLMELDMNEDLKGKNIIKKIINNNDSK